MLKSEARKLALEYKKDSNDLNSIYNIIDELKKNKLFLEAKTVGLYFPLRKEINLMSLLFAFKDKEFYLPITENNELGFVKYELYDSLKYTDYKTKEPYGMAVDINEIDLIIVPCVATSQDGKRVGYGKGFYDRGLKEYKGIKFGIVRDQFYNMDITMDYFDLKLDFIIRGE